MTIPGKKKQAHIVSVFSFPNSFPNLYSQHFYSILFVLKSAGEKFTLLLFYDQSCECNCSFLRSIFRMKDLIKKDKKNRIKVIFYTVCVTKSHDSFTHD